MSDTLFEHIEKDISATLLTAVHKELIKIRASQINGCAYCINIHTDDTIRHSVSQ